MDNRVFVAIVNGGEHLAKEEPELVLREVPIVRNVLEELTLSDTIHGQDVVPVSFEDIVQLHNVRVVQQRQEPNLTAQALLLLLRKLSLRNKLEGNLHHDHQHRHQQQQQQQQQGKEGETRMSEEGGKTE